MLQPIVFVFCFFLKKKQQLQPSVQNYFRNNFMHKISFSSEISLKNIFRK